jgi:hypothetical protein
MRFVVHRYHQDRNSREHRPQVFDEFKPAFSREVEIGEDQVGPAILHHGHGFVRLSGFAANNHVILSIDKLGEPHPHEWMIVDEHNAFWGGA